MLYGSDVEHVITFSDF